MFQLKTIIIELLWSAVKIFQAFCFIPQIFNLYQNAHPLLFRPGCFTACLMCAECPVVCPFGRMRKVSHWGALLSAGFVAGAPQGSSRTVSLSKQRSSLCSSCKICLIASVLIFQLPLRNWGWTWWVRGWGVGIIWKIIMFFFVLLYQTN